MKLKHSLSLFLTLSLCSLSACKAEGGPKLDPEIIKAFENVMANCEVSTSGNTVTKCKNEEMKNLKAMFQAKGKDAPAQKDKIESLDTFSHALGHEKTEMGVVASSAMYTLMRDFGASPDPTKFKGDVAKRLIDAVGKSPKYQAAQALRGAVHVGMLSGERDHLFAMIDGHAYDQIPGFGLPTYHALCPHGCF